MPNYTQLFVGVFILYCVFTPSLSLPRVQILDPEPSETCFVVDIYGGIHVTDLAVDSEGNKCGLRGSLNVGQLFNKTHIKEANAEAKDEICPTWQRSKNCLIDHFNSDKCNEEELRTAKGASSFNIQIVIRELLCNPRSTHSSLHLLTNTENNGIWECFLRPNFRELFDGCRSSLFPDGQRPSFQTFISLFGCLNAAVARCADGDIIKEQNMLRAWNEVGSAWKAAHGQFWGNV